MTTIKFLIVIFLFTVILAVEPKCSDLEQMECTDDIYYAYPACKKAAE